jgi:hypothetical protein
MVYRTLNSDSGGSNGSPGISEVLSTLNHHLRNGLEGLEKSNAELAKNLHNDESLPDRKLLEQAAQTVDLLHKIQMLLDPPALVLADQFLG